uniref:BAG family molecular chaperone regulator 8, chloroplastic n=1 Tax=Davidia involucrata TaxID=16924 RepID=A0A5B7BL47_DAVIN
MASHHHHPHPYQCHHHHNSHPTTTATYCCCCGCGGCTPSPHPPPPDPLLQSIASHLLHPPPPQPHLYSPYLNTPCDPYKPHHHQTQFYPSQTHHQKQQQFQHHQQLQQQQTQPIVSSLLRRIAALESSLRHQFHANPTSSHSLRDAAARTIQTHFRAFLVRRSRTLRQLKDLAFIKSTLNTLKTSLSDNTHLDSQTLSHEAIDLLLKLDYIQGGDPMIRDGKRSISRELIRFIEFVDGVYVKRNELSSRRVQNERCIGTGNKSRVLYSGHRMGNAECGDLDGYERNLMEKLRGRVEKIHGLSRVSEDDDDEGDLGLEKPSISNNGRFGFSQNRNGGLVKRSGGVQAKVKKRVSFAEDGDVSRSTHEPISSGDVNGSDGSGSIDDEIELVDNFCKEIEEIGGFAKETEDDEEGNIEDGGSSQISDGERNPRSDLRAEGNYEIRGQYQGQNGNFVFSAPLPVQMESRADLLKKKKALKIVN